MWRVRMPAEPLRPSESSAAQRTTGTLIAGRTIRAKSSGTRPAISSVIAKNIQRVGAVHAPRSTEHPRRFAPPCLSQGASRNCACASGVPSGPEVVL